MRSARSAASQGRKLAAGDVLPVGAATPSAPRRPQLRGRPAPAYPKSLELRVLPGLYLHRITDEAGRRRSSRTPGRSRRKPTASATASARGGRWSFRERKQPFGAGSDPSNIVDAGYPYGSIQVPGGLEPIILHRDAVSGGGYAMIGTVISADMDRIAQMQPNNLARFVEVDMDGALKARAEYKGRVARLTASLRQ